MLEQALAQLADCYLTDEDITQVDDWADRLIQTAQKRHALFQVIQTIKALQADFKQALTANGLERLLAWDPSTDSSQLGADPAIIGAATRKLGDLMEELKTCKNTDQFMRIAELTPRMKEAGDQLIAILFGEDHSPEDGDGSPPPLEAGDDSADDAAGEALDTIADEAAEAPEQNDGGVASLEEEPPPATADEVPEDWSVVEQSGTGVETETGEDENGGGTEGGVGADDAEVEGGKEQTSEEVEQDTAGAETEPGDLVDGSAAEAPDEAGTSQGVAAVGAASETDGEAGYSDTTETITRPHGDDGPLEPERAFWHCIQEQKWAWAWWLSLALERAEDPIPPAVLPPWLAETLWLATYCHPDSQLNSERRWAREKIEEQVWKGEAETLQKERQYIIFSRALAAASLLPAFYDSPGHSAYNWLAGSLDTNEAWAELPETAKLLRQTEEILRQSVPLHSWQAADITARLKERLESIRQRVEASTHEAQNAQTKYVFAGHTQRTMLGDDNGVLRRALDPIKAGNLALRNQVQSAVEELRNADRVNLLIQDNFKKTRQRANRRQTVTLKGPAGRGVKNTIDNLRGLAEEWLEVADQLGQTQKQAWQDDQIEEVRHQWAQQWQHVRDELAPASPASGDDVWYKMVVNTHLSRCIMTVGRSVMGHDIPEEYCLPLPEAPADEQRDRVLWQLPDVWSKLRLQAADDWTLDTGQAVVMVERLTGRLTALWTDEAIIKEACDEGRFTLADHIITSVADISEETRMLYENSVAASRDSLQQECDNSLARLDEALAQGAISYDAHREAAEILDCQRLNLRKDSPESGIFDAPDVSETIRATVNRLSDYTRQRHNETQSKIEALEQRLQADPGLRSGPEDRLQLAEEWLSKGREYLEGDQYDLVEAACEQAEAALRGESTAVQRSTFETLNSWRQRLRKLEKWLLARSPYAQLNAHSTQAPLDFSRLNKIRIQECQQMGAQVRQLKGLSPARSNSKQMEKLLKQIFGDYLGFEIREVKYEHVARAGQTYAQFILKTTPVTDGNRIAVPKFGSEAQGNYRVVVVWDRPQVTNFRLFVGESVGQTATFLLYPAPMSPEKWRQWEVEVARSKESTPFIVIDECLLAHVADNRDNRMRALFETALSYTNLNPYQPFMKVAPEMFVGRKQDLQRLGDRGGSYIIYGGRQLGKSAILEQLERLLHRPEDQSWVIRDDFKTIGGEGSLNPTREFWDRVVSRINNLDRSDLKIATNCKPETIVEQLIRHFQENSSQRLLLLVDEADNFLTHDAGQGFQSVSLLRRAIDQTNNGFKVVFAGLHNVQRFEKQSNHPLLQLGTPICLGPLASLDAGELIQRPMGALGYEVTDEAVLKIRVYSSDHPGLIQYFCRELLDLHRRRRAEGRPNLDENMPFQITVEDVEQVFNREDTRNELLKRFKATVDLDPQYQVLLYSQLFSGESTNIPFAAREALEMSREWWPEGFARLDVRQVSLMLDEMVGLGVLQRQAGEEPMWYVRNRQVVRLLGGVDNIASELERFLQDPPSLKPTPGRIHLRLRELPGGISPLTQQQLAEVAGRGDGLAELGRLDSALVMLQSIKASGQYRLREAVTQLAWPHWDNEDQEAPFEFRVADPSDDLAQLKAQAGRLQSQKGKQFAILWVPDEITSQLADNLVEYIWELASSLQAARSSKTPVRVLFDLGFEATWTWAHCCAETTANDDRHIIDLPVRPWSAEAHHTWLKSHDVLDPQGTAQRLHEITGGWHLLVEEFWQRFIGDDARASRNANAEDCLNIMAEELDSPESELAREVTSALMPLQHWPEPALSIWQELSIGPLREIDLPGLAELRDHSKDELQTTLKFMAQLGYIQLQPCANSTLEDATAQWSANPVAARLLPGG